MSTERMPLADALGHAQSRHPQPDYIGEPCKIAPSVGGLVTERDHRVCYHGELWHALDFPAVNT